MSCYVHIGNIFFKFARDSAGLYGNDGLAQKSAANELRAMDALIRCGEPLLHTTLTALVFVRGHCVVATALAPIGSNTLVCCFPQRLK